MLIVTAVLIGDDYQRRLNKGEQGGGHCADYDGVRTAKGVKTGPQALRRGEAAVYQERLDTGYVKEYRAEVFYLLY